MTKFITLKEIADTYNKENNKLVKSFERMNKPKYLTYSKINIEIASGRGGNRKQKINSYSFDIKTVLWFLGSAKLLGKNEHFENNLVTNVNHKVQFVPVVDRVELEFSNQLTDYLTELDIEVLYQYKVLNYRIDFYLPDLNIAIEYDEEYHMTVKQKNLDKIRQTAIEKEIGCKFIRISVALSVGAALAKIQKELK